MHSASAKLDAKLFRRTLFRRALLALHIILALVSAFVLLSLWYRPTLSTTLDFRKSGGGVAPIVAALPALVPYAISAKMAIPQVTSHIRDFFIVACGLLLGTGGAAYLIFGPLSEGLDMITICQLSFLEATLFAFVAHFGLDGIDD